MRRIARCVRLVFGSGRKRSRRARRPAATGCCSPSGSGRRPRALRAREESLHDFVVLLRKHRAGDIQQFTIRARAPAKAHPGSRAWRVANAADIAGAAQPLEVGMAPRDAGGRARHVGKDAVEGRAVPPRRAAACSRPRARRARKAQPLQVALDALAALRRPRRARSARRRARSRMCAALAARRGAGIEHALARREIEAAPPRAARLRPAPRPRRRQSPADARPAPAARAAALRRPARARGDACSAQRVAASPAQRARRDSRAAPSADARCRPPESASQRLGIRAAHACRSTSADAGSAPRRRRCMRASSAARSRR